MKRSLKVSVPISWMPSKKLRIELANHRELGKSSDETFANGSFPDSL